MEVAKKQSVDPLPDPQELMTWVFRFRAGHVRGKGWGSLREPMKSCASSSFSDGQSSNQVDVLLNELYLFKTQHMEEMEAMSATDSYNKEISYLKAQLAYVLIS